MNYTEPTTKNFICKYCEDALVYNHGGVCGPCEAIAYKVRAEEKRHWATVVEQELQQTIRRMKE